MTRDEIWLKHWKKVMRFMDVNDRNPSKHHPEEMDMINWLKSNRKKRNAGKLEPQRVDKFKELTTRMTSLRRLNQHTPPAYIVKEQNNHSAK